jgi:hypothetical protein
VVVVIALRSPRQTLPAANELGLDGGAMLRDLCFFLMMMLLAFAPALALALWRLWSRTRPRVLTFTLQDPKAMLGLLDGLLAPVGLSRAPGIAVPAVYEPNAVRRTLGMAAVTADWRPPAHATLAGPNQLLSRMARRLPGSRLEPSSAPWPLQRTVRRLASGYIAILALLASTLLGLWGYRLARVRPDGTSPDDLQITLELTRSEVNYPLERNVLVEQTGRYVFVTAPAGLKDGDHLRFARQGRSNGLAGRGDLVVTIRVK